jgi:hypothetical protein
VKLAVHGAELRGNHPGAVAAGVAGGPFLEVGVGLLQILHALAVTECAGIELYRLCACMVIISVIGPENAGKTTVGSLQG